MLDSIYCVKMSRFYQIYARMLWTSFHTFTKICKPLVVYRFFIHGVISLPDTTSYEAILKIIFVCRAPTHQYQFR